MFLSTIAGKLFFCTTSVTDQKQGNLNSNVHNLQKTSVCSLYGLPILLALDQKIMLQRQSVILINPKLTKQKDTSSTRHC